MTRRSDDAANAEPTALRRWFAEELQLSVGIRNAAVVDAFAAVPRERFVGPGPWHILSPRNLPHREFQTPDSEPHWLYHDVLVRIDAARGLNNGQPSLWASVFDELNIGRGQRVLQVGAGTGYFSAVLAEIVGPGGRVVVVEYDEALAERTRDNLAPWPQAEARPGDGRTVDAGMVDAIVAFAGSTHPAALWLDRLNEGGQLLMPLTGANWWGFLLCVTRRGAAFEARSIGPVGIFPCIDGRDQAASVRLERKLRDLDGAAVPIVALHRGSPDAADAERVWFDGPGFWLEASQAK